MIKLNVIGNLGKDALVNTVNGRNVINFTVAHTEKFKDAQGTQKERTEWVDCAYWTDRTAIAPYLKKGTQVYVDGNPDVRTYTNQQGQTSGIITLRVSNIQLLGSKNNEGAPATGGYNNNYSGAGTTSAVAESIPANVPGPSDIDDSVDDLPF